MKRINLLQPEAKKASHIKFANIGILKSPVSRVIAAALVGFVSLNIWQATSLLRHEFAITASKRIIASQEAKLAQAQKAREQVKAQKEEIAKEKKRVEGKIRALQQTHGERKDWAGILAEISKLVPDDLWITKIKLNKDSATIAGATSGNTIVSRFMSALDESDYFGRTDFNYTQKGKSTERPVINFEITTRLVMENVVSEGQGSNE